MIWWLGKQHTAEKFSDMLFMVGGGAFCVGGLFAVIASSRRSYYRYIKEKAKGVVDCEQKYAWDMKNKEKKIRTGFCILFAGLIGMAISGYIFNL
jgi:hypothetical protein